MKTKICTSIEQSKKLLELGLDADTADMYYKYVVPNSDRIMHNPKIGPPLKDLELYNEGYTFSGKKALTVEKFCIPAWSLSALLDLMPTHFALDYISQTWMAYNTKYGEKSINANNPLDAVFKLMCYLIEQGCIKIEK